MAGLPDLEFVLYRGREVTGIVRSLEDEVVQRTEEADVASEPLATERYIGVAEVTAALSGFYESDIAAAFDGSPEGVLMYVLGGNTVGARCQCIDAVVAHTYKRSIEAEGVHKAEVAFRGGSLPESARLVAPLATRSGGAGGNTQATPADDGAGSAGSGIFWLSVPQLNLSSRTNVKLALYDSADGSSFSERSALTLTAADVPGAWAAPVEATLRRYLAVTWSYGGSGGSPSVRFAAAVTRNL